VQVRPGHPLPLSPQKTSRRVGRGARAALGSQSLCSHAPSPLAARSLTPRRQLGFGPAAGPVAGPQGRFAPAPPHLPTDQGWGATWREHPWRCAGDEPSLNACGFDAGAINPECGHEHDVWLECAPAPTPAAAAAAAASAKGGAPAAGGGGALRRGRSAEAAEAGDLSGFFEAMGAAGLMGELEDPSKAATAFAPTTRALARLRAQLGPANAGFLLGSPSVLRRLMRYHLVRGRALDFDRLSDRAAETPGRRLALTTADGAAVEVVAAPRGAATGGGRRLAQGAGGEREWDLFVDGEGFLARGGARAPGEWGRGRFHAIEAFLPQAARPCACREGGRPRDPSTRRAPHPNPHPDPAQPPLHRRPANPQACA
jgi:hypothetical protein